MATFREAREALLLANDLNLIDDEELLLLYDVNTSKNLEIPYWKYDKFDLDSLSDDECKSEFRFLKHDIYALVDVFNLPDKITCPNRFSVYSDEALCMLLRRFAYPCRYEDLVPRFGRPVPQLSMVVGEAMDLLHVQFGRLLSRLNQPWLSQAQLAQFSEAIYRKGAALDNCWGFIDGTVRPVCRPGENQRVLYNGHKRVHAIKFQSVVAPNGLIANLFGPVEGRRHDSGMLAMSGLLPMLENHCVSPTGQPLCVYGDPAYPLRVHLQQQYNLSMSKVRTAVEWVFGDILQYFTFFRFQKGSQSWTQCRRQNVYYLCLIKKCPLMSLWVKYSSFFGVEPPSLQGYFI